MPRGISCWAVAGVEPSINDVLSEPIVHTMMRADGVHFVDLLAIIVGYDDPNAAERDRSRAVGTDFDWTHGSPAGS